MSRADRRVERLTELIARAGTCLAILLAVQCGGDQSNEPTGSCRPGCEIAFDSIAIISDAAEPGILPGRFFFIDRGRDGVLVIPSGNARQVAAFDSTGQLLSVIGRSGSGPGEFQMVRKPMFGPGDSLHVPDFRLRRIAVFSPDFAFVRSFPFIHLPELLLADGSYLVTRALPGISENGYPVHRYAPDGRLLTAFGSDTPQTALDLRLITNVRVAHGRDGSVWSVAPGQYVLERWDPTTGQKLQRAEVPSSWFRPAEAWIADENIRPVPVIEGHWEDEHGFVWVLIRDSDTNWRPPPNANIERVMSDEEYNVIYDWVLEVVDPTINQVLASKRVDEVLWYRGPAPLLASPLPVDTLVAFQLIRPYLRPVS